ncbi:MAG: DUF3299 domain-containing protein [Vibrio sp.]
MKNIICGFLLIFLSLFSLTAQANEEVLTLKWIDLIPEGDRHKMDFQAIPVVNHSANIPIKQSMLGAVRNDLNGHTVKIPGFIIPLEGDENTVTEFLLVPYFGACIHVPPPPPNQIIYVKSPKGTQMKKLWDVVYVVGTLKTESVSVDLASTGYVIENGQMLEFDDKD